MDNPDNSATIVLSDKQLLEYLDRIEEKTLNYLDSITDEMLYKKPKNCPNTRMELVLRQFRYLSFYTGMLNGRIRSKSTIVSTSSTKGNMSTGTAFFMR